MMVALCAVDKASIDGQLKDMSTEQRATVMKYVFKCMSFPTDKKNYEHLLVWHGKLVALEGLGVIMRAMVDRSV